MKLRVPLCSCGILLAGATLFAQNVQWASRVIDYSSQYSDTTSSAEQILGRPNALPLGGDSPLAWAVGTDDSGYESDAPASITVGFDRPMPIRQVAIGESCAPGAITRVVAIDDANRQHQMYSALPQAIDDTTRVLTISMNRTPYNVKAVMISLEPGQVDGWNELDAVGISDSDTPITMEINLAPEALSIAKPEHLGRTINTAASELTDGISPDGRTLYVSRLGDPNNVGGADAGRDVWYSTMNSDGSWAEAVNIGPPINNEANNYVNAVSPDGNTLLLGNKYDANGNSIASGISMSHRTATGWSLPESVEIDDDYNESSTGTYGFSPDGRVILLSVRRHDTKGEHDLYVTFLKDDGTWTTPLNMGPTINTVGDEVGPFIAADGVTMYYSTDGLSGYGGNDIFLTRRLDSTWTNWSEPENLGPGVNTPGYDAFYYVPASGEYAYFSSSNDSYGADDIFRVALPKGLRPESVVLVHGKVFDATTRKPIGANIRYENLTNGEEAGIARSNPADGSYTISLPAGTNFGFRGEADGYYPISENLNTAGLMKFKEIEKDLYLVPIAVGKTIRLNNVFFSTGKWDLRPESYSELNRAAEFLKANPGITISVDGHTDNVGSDADNQLLSQRRAKAVADYLTAHGVAASRLTSHGYGETKPVAPNTTDEGRQLNRRVEFTIESI